MGQLAQKWLVCEPLGIHLEPINPSYAFAIIPVCGRGVKEICRNFVIANIWNIKETDIHTA